MTFEIKEAVRQGAPPLIGLWGGSFTGKTFSALLMARGIVGPDGKIGLIDTENGRALFHTGVGGKWFHLDLQPPFTPGRYTDAFKQFEDVGGFGCVIVDSFSHCWEGQGGVLDMADGGKTRDGRALQGLKKWQAPKMEYKRMVNALLRAPFAVIFCLRAKDGVKQIGAGNDAKIESTGVQPISGKGFIHELTVSALIGPDHFPVFPGPQGLVQCDPLVPAVKTPDDLRDIFQPGQFIGIETGKRIADWSAGVVPFDVEKARLEREARNVCSMGTEAYGRFWKQIGVDGQKKLIPIHEELKSLAAEADADALASPDYGDHEEGLPL